MTDDYRPYQDSDGASTPPEPATPLTWPAVAVFAVLCATILAAIWMLTR